MFSLITLLLVVPVQPTNTTEQSNPHSQETKSAASTGASLDIICNIHLKSRLFSIEHKNINGYLCIYIQL